MNRDELDALASGLTKVQRTCGDLLDSFPCVACGATGFGKCTLPLSARIPVRDLINGTLGLGNHLRAHVGRIRRTHLTQNQGARE